MQTESESKKKKKKLSIIARKACLFQAIPSPSPPPAHNLSKKNSCTGGSFSLHCDKKKVKKFASSAEKTQGTAALLKIWMKWALMHVAGGEKIYIYTYRNVCV